MKLRYLSLSLMTATLLAGCSTTVVFTSDIEGATVTNSQGQLYGVTPTDISYDNEALEGSKDIDGCARIVGVTYKWPSGATVTSDNPIVLCGDQSRYVFKMDRPKDAPGVETDLQNAIERMKVREAQLQADLERERLYADHFFFMGPGMMMRMPPAPPPRHPRPPHRPPRPRH